MFVGPRRNAAVDRLVRDWAHVCSRQGPQMVALTAPLGWGKTRVIQEFYERVASRDHSGYWPKRMVSSTDIVDVSTLAVERKRLQPEPFPVTGNPPYVWLSVHADPSEFARPEEAYRVLIEQLEPHLARILRTKRLTRAAAKSLWKALTAFIPIPSDIDSYKDAAGAGRDFADDWRSDRRSARIVGASRSEEQAANFWRLLTAVWGTDGEGGPPLIIAIEDAHFVSSVSVDLLRALLASNIPCLVVAAGWPVEEDADPRVQPYREFLRSAPGRLRVDALDALEDPDIRQLIRAWHPFTSEDVVSLLARRTGGNPYALRLALIRLGSRRGEPVSAELDRIRQMPFDIHTQFENLLWAMRTPSRLSLAAVATLGSRLPTELASSGANAVDADILAALSTDWLRPEGLSEQLVAFVEPLRHEVAYRHGVQHFSSSERMQILQAGVRSLRHLLMDELSDADRGLLCELHILFAEEGAEAQIDSVLESATELLRILRNRQARPAIHEVFRRVSHIDMSHADDVARAEYLVERARSYRYASDRSDPAVARALDEARVSVERLDHRRPDLTAVVWAEDARLHRDADVPSLYDLQVARASLDQALRIAETAILPEEVRHLIRTCEYGTVSAEGDRAAAAQLALREAVRCRLPDGAETLSSLETLGDAAWYAARGGQAELAVELSRRRVDLQVQFWGTGAHPRVAISSKDLAVRLVRVGRPQMVEEAYQRIDAAYRAIEAAFGAEDRSTLLALSARGYIRIRFAWLLHSGGSAHEHASSLIAQGLEDAEVVLGIRQRRFPEADHLLSRERAALARALFGDVNAIDELIAMRERRLHNRRQPPDQAEVRWLGEDIVRAFHHSGQHARASEFAASHGIGPLPESS